jgi:hypothetical protein
VCIKITAGGGNYGLFVQALIMDNDKPGISSLTLYILAKWWYPSWRLKQSNMELKPDQKLAIRIKEKCRFIISKTNSRILMITERGILHDLRCL